LRKSAVLLLVLVFLTASIIVVLLAHVNSDPLPDGDSLPDGDGTADGAGESHGVEITDFKWTSGWQYLGGVTHYKLFNITIHSLEANDAEGLDVQVKLFAGGRELQATAQFFGPGIIGQTATHGSFDGLIGAGEVLELRGIMITSLSELPSDFDAVTVVVKVVLGDVVLDELTVP